MAEGEGCIELKFRIYDGTDIAHSTYSSSTTVGTLKQKLVAEWPQGLSSCLWGVSDCIYIYIYIVFLYNGPKARSDFLYISFS